MIPAEAIEAAAKAMFGAESDTAPYDVEAAIRAADEVRGMEVQRDGFVAMYSGQPHFKRYRLVSRWFPVKP